MDKRIGFVGMMQNPNNDFIDDPVIDRKDLRGHPKKEIQEYINRILQECSGLILLIGENTHCRPVVDFELDVAQSKRIPIIPVRIPETLGGLPNRLKRTHLNSDIITWNSEIIQESIDNKFGR